jgi:hypothetical protein
MRDAASGGRSQSRNPEQLSRLLLRLDPDVAHAWERYADIRNRLAKFFEWNHCLRSEDLADEVLDRVAAKPDSEEIREVEKYSLGVARFVCLEAHKGSGVRFTAKTCPAERTLYLTLTISQRRSWTDFIRREGLLV